MTPATIAIVMPTGLGIYVQLTHEMIARTRKGTSILVIGNSFLVFGDEFILTKREGVCALSFCVRRCRQNRLAEALGYPLAVQCLCVACVLHALALLPPPFMRVT